MSLNIISWNCQNGLSSKDKNAYIQKLNPSVLILQEVKEKDLKGTCLSKCYQHFWVTNNKEGKNPKGLGIYIFDKDVSAELIPLEMDFELFLPVRITRKGIDFDIVSVWDFNHRAKGKYKGQKGVIYQAIDFYQNILNEKSIWMGDFNNGPEIKACKSWLNIVERMFKDGYQKAIIENSELRKTHTHNRGKSFEIDHCFLRGIQQFKFGLANSCIGNAKSPSDHKPIKLEIFG